MRIFHNPKDRKGLEENERKAFEASVKLTKNDRVESESAGGSASESKPTTEETKEASKKARKEKVD